MHRRQMMKGKNTVVSWYVGSALGVAGLALILAVTMSGCGVQAAATPAAVAGEEAVVSAPADVGGGKADGDTAIDTSYPDALDVSDQLALGTLLLEGTGQAITPEQAAALLPLWQVIQGGTLQGETEINAVLSQIEGEMTAEQLAAIAGEQLTAEDQQAWAQEQGLGFGAGDGSGRMAGGEGLSEEERAQRMAEMGLTEDDMPAGIGELSAEEREALRATAEASGMVPGGGAGAGPGRSSVMLGPLVELLAQRTAE
jgi:hypothetical protein